MEELAIETVDGKRNYRPGESLGGLVRWKLSRVPQTIELRLFWRTVGAGASDVGLASTVDFEQPNQQESRSFLFIAPASPVSFSGQLISLIWSLELVATGSGECARLDLVVSATGEELVPKSAERAHL